MKRIIVSVVYRICEYHYFLCFLVVAAAAVVDVFFFLMINFLLIFCF